MPVLWPRANHAMHTFPGALLTSDLKAGPCSNCTRLPGIHLKDRVRLFLTISTNFPFPLRFANVLQQLMTFPRSSDCKAKDNLFFLISRVVYPGRLIHIHVTLSHHFPLDYFGSQFALLFLDMRRLSLPPDLSMKPLPFFSFQDRSRFWPDSRRPPSLRFSPFPVIHIRLILCSSCLLTVHT